jgi:hypothetical protein
VRVSAGRPPAVSGLGVPASVVMEPEIADRIAFWCEVHESLAALGNRPGPELDKIMDALHQRIPMPTVEEQRQLQLENVRSDERAPQPTMRR